MNNTERMCKLTGSFNRITFFHLWSTTLVCWHWLKNKLDECNLKCHHHRSMSDTRHTFNHKRRCYIMFYHERNIHFKRSRNSWYHFEFIKLIANSNMHQSSETNGNHEITCFGHANATVNDGKSIVGFVRNKPNEKLWLPIKLALISQTFKPNFVQSLQKPHPKTQLVKFSINQILTEKQFKSKGKLINRLFIKHNANE